MDCIGSSKKYLSAVHVGVGMFLTLSKLIAWGGNELALGVLERAHSHNDYVRNRPLYEALESGFNSVEADVFLVRGKLLVGHFWLFLRESRTLEGLYLERLREITRTNGGWIHQKGVTFWLWIEIKSEPLETYSHLRKVLHAYREILTEFEGDVVRTNAVTVVLTGRRPISLMKTEAIRYATLDCRLQEVVDDGTPNLYLWVNEDWSRHFSWQGDGEMPEDEWKLLREMVERVHKAGRKIRFWGSPDKPPVWDKLWRAGVDLISTDDVVGLRDWICREAPKAGDLKGTALGK